MQIEASRHSDHSDIRDILHKYTTQTNYKINESSKCDKSSAKLERLTKAVINHPKKKEGWNEEMKGEKTMEGKKQKIKWNTDLVKY